MPTRSARRICAAGAVSLVALLISEATAQQAAQPPYVLLLRSREAVVTPERSKDAQTGGGFIQVTQVEPNVIMVLMRGAAAAGGGVSGGHHKEGMAAIQFLLNQDFEIVATRANLRPPRLVLAGWAIGALESTLKGGGMAEHSPACAAVHSGGQSILNLCLKPHGVGGGENLLVNDRVGPLEQAVVPGLYCLNQTFAVRASHPRTYCHDGSAAAQFDPEPKLDAQWNEVLKPFRAAPHRDFGFRVILRVVEDLPPAGGVSHSEPDDLPLPKEEKNSKKH